MDDYGKNSQGDDEELEVYADLEGLSIDDILRQGQKALFIQLVGRCRSGKANHQEMAILRNLLRDNGLTLGIPPEAKDTGPAMDLPSFDKPDYE